MAPRSDASVIVFGPDHWGPYRQTRHHVAAALAAKGWPVTYTTGPHFVWELRREKWRHARWRTTTGAADGVILNWPGRFQTRWPRIAVWDASVSRRYCETLQRQSGWRDARHRIAYLFRPQFAPELDRLGDCRVVYHADDSFSKMPGWTTEMEALEHRLVARADLLVAASEGMRRNLGAGGERAHVLNNGVDADMFIRGASEPCPADIASIPRPRLGYFGWLNPKVDIRLIQTIAVARPDWHWVLVGAVNERDIASSEVAHAPWEALGRMANVHILGPRPYRDLPRYQAHMDVNTLCYRSDPGGWWEDLSPLKLYEYLAVGRHVVSSPLETLDSLRHIVAVATGPAEWSRAIETALRAGPGPAQEAGRELAQRNRWVDVGAKLDVWLLELISGAVSSSSLRVRRHG